MAIYRKKVNYRREYPDLNDAIIEVLEKSDRKMEYQQYDLKVERCRVDTSKQNITVFLLRSFPHTLLDERHPERKIERAKQALYDAYVESERSLDEIIDLIRNADEWI